LNARQRKVLQRLLDAGDGGFAGGLNAEKYMSLAGTSKPTASRDLAEMVIQGQPWTRGLGRALRYCVNVPGWTHGVERSADAAARVAPGAAHQGPDSGGEGSGLPTIARVQPQRQH
jgi:hypothetical protein